MLNLFWMLAAALVVLWVFGLATSYPRGRKETSHA
jgi:hypothetical protein